MTQCELDAQALPDPVYSAWRALREQVFFDVAERCEDMIPDDLPDHEFSEALAEMVDEAMVIVVDQN